MGRTKVILGGKVDSIYLIIASQDYECANHKGLWEKLAEEPKCKVIVANIPADGPVSLISRHTERIADAKKGVRRLGDSLFIFRPILSVRPEMMPEFLYPFVAKEFWRYFDNVFPGLKKSRIRVVVYNAYWVKVLKGSRDGVSFGYYLFDDVRFNGKDGNVNKKRFVQDEFACRNSDVVFAMSKNLAESRASLNENTIVFGNGATEPQMIQSPANKLVRSFAFVGNFRNWIDRDLLSGLIAKRKDILFVFVGSVEKDMAVFLENLLNENLNTLWFGQVEKESMPEVYTMFNGVIVPYRDNVFVKSTRPIKIVESVMSGTPVVTVPISGYECSSFIRFANDVDSFSKEIDYLLDHPIDRDCDEFTKFVQENTWSTKAKTLIRAFEKLDNEARH